MEWTRRRFAGLAGIVAAGLALGVGELAAGIFDQVPSPLAAIGGIVVENTPPAVERWAISLFGTADKAVLAVGIAVVALVIGWFTGKAALRRFWVAAVVIGGFGAAGFAASLSEPHAVAAAVAAASLISVAAGLGLLWALLRSLAPDASADPGAETIPSDPERRRFLALAGIGGAAAVGAGAVGRVLVAAVPPPPAVELSAAEAIPVGPEHDFLVDGLSPIVVPADEFYRIDTALAIPRIEPEDWSLRIHGMVDRELTLTYDDLTSADLVERYVTLQCVSNQVGGSLVGNALWSGLPLQGLLEEAGVARTGTQVVGRSIDDWTAGFPIEAVFDGREPILAVGMNGDVLPRRHGFPARLVVPGLYGYVSATKWITEIEITGWDDFDGYWVPRGWAKEGPIKTQSRIDLPRRNATVDGPDVLVAGVAWAPTRGIEAVEVRFDGGPWQQAEVSVPLSDQAWVQWRATAALEPGGHRVEVRATDGDGGVQTDVVRPPAPDGATGHHMVSFTVA
ncbi:MAG: molybdopterin-dependent oxidoreductase [Actinobacteria bacterium]|nr:molybdopterin-dependent oxidoreductase [Actinomycetota bacterium]